MAKIDLVFRQIDERTRDVALELAKEFLNRTLVDGPFPAKQIRLRAQQHGNANRTLDQAKKELGDASRRVAGAGHGNGHWVWLLPSVEPLPPSPADCPTELLDGWLEPNGHGSGQEPEDPVEWWKRGHLN